MSNSVALWLFLLIAAALVFDYVMGWGATMFTLRKFLDLLDLLTFWR